MVPRLAVDKKQQLPPAAPREEQVITNKMGHEAELIPEIPLKEQPPPSEKDPEELPQSEHATVP